MTESWHFFLIGGFLTEDISIDMEVGWRSKDLLYLVFE